MNAAYIVCNINIICTNDNYKLMYNICKSLKVKDIFYDIANNIYNTLNESRNSYKQH